MADIIRIENTGKQASDIPELAVFASMSERQLMQYGPEHGLFIAESPNVIAAALDAGYEPVSFLMEEKHIEKEAAEVIGRAGSAPVYTADAAMLKQITGFQLTRGILCAMRRKKLPGIQEVLRDAQKIAVLENVMNPANLGAVMRSAAALGMDAVILSPGCSDPLYRRAARVSMGGVFRIPWTFISQDMSAWPEEGMAFLKTCGFYTAALALDETAVTIGDPALKHKDRIALILGTEGSGLMPETVRKCDCTVKIPMYGGMDSLNVAAAAAVAFYAVKH